MSYRFLHYETLCHEKTMMRFQIHAFSLCIIVTLAFATRSAERVQGAEKAESETCPIGVIARFDDHGTGLTLEKAMQSGVSVIQLKVPAKENRTEKNLNTILETLRKHKVKVVCVLGGFSGESYASIPIVKETVGLVPAGTRKERLEDFKDTSDFAKKLGAPAVQFHLGFVPHDRQSEDYKDIVKTTREVCDYIAKNDQWLQLETGQETGEALLQFLKDVDRKNLFVNFDPANMILYGCGEPNEALEILGPHVRSTHCKDALWSENPGKDWGKEVLFGTGAVNAQRFAETLKKFDYKGPLIIERENKESPEHQYADIVKTISFLEELKKKTGLQ